VSEEAVLGRILPLLPAGRATLLGPGDDAAVLGLPDGRVVVSVDVLVEGVHFRPEWLTGADLGYRAAMQNLADVAAMGARPIGLVVGLVTPPGTPLDWFESVAEGLAQACAPLGVGVVGGDLSTGPAIVVSVTVLGDLEGRAPVTRAGACPGDVLGLAGVVGWSAAGLALLMSDAVGPGIGWDDAVPEGWSEAAARAVRGYQRPEPPLEAGVAAGIGGARAMMDVSDGLGVDLHRLAVASGVSIDLSLEGPLAEARAELAPLAAVIGVDPLDWVLGGGEDHGLVASFPEGAALPVGWRRIGRVAEGPPQVRLDGRPVPPKGWDHFG
jgi:thiamine-monophosphate kinase